MVQLTVKFAGAPTTGAHWTLTEPVVFGANGLPVTVAVPFVDVHASVAVWPAVPAPAVTATVPAPVPLIVRLPPEAGLNDSCGAVGPAAMFTAPFVVVPASEPPS